MGKESGKSTKVSKPTHKKAEFKEKIIEFAKYKTRPEVKVILKYEEKKLPEEHIKNNFEPRLEQTLKNFDKIWTDCPEMPPPASEKKLVVQITIYGEFQKCFIHKGGYIEHVPLGKRMWAEWGFATEKKVSDCYVYQRNKNDTIYVRSLEHEFAHALMNHWIRANAGYKTICFEEGGADLIAHGLKICPHFQKRLNRFFKACALGLETIQLFQTTSSIEKKDLKRVGYVLPHIKLLYIRKTNPNTFGKMVREWKKFDSINFIKLEQSFLKKYNELFKEWVNTTRALPLKEVANEMCTVNFAGDIYSLRASNNKDFQAEESDSEQSITSISSSAFFNSQEKSVNHADSKHELKGIDTLSDLFKHPETTELLKIWGITDINTLYDKLDDFCERPHPHFLKNIKLAAEERALFRVYSVCGLECMQEAPSLLAGLIAFQDRATHYIKNYPEGNKASKKASGPQQRKLLKKLLQEDYSDIFIKLATICGVQNTYRTLYDFYSFADKIDTILDEEKICEKILSAIDPTESFRKIANKKLSEITAQPMVPPSKSAPNVAKEPTKHKTSQDKHKHKHKHEKDKKFSTGAQESHSRRDTRRPKP